MRHINVGSSHLHIHHVMRTTSSDDVNVQISRQRSRVTPLNYPILLPMLTNTMLFDWIVSHVQVSLSYFVLTVLCISLLLRFICGDVFRYTEDPLSCNGANPRDVHFYCIQHPCLEMDVYPRSHCIIAGSLGNDPIGRYKKSNPFILSI